MVWLVIPIQFLRRLQKYWQGKVWKRRLNIWRANARETIGEVDRLIENQNQAEIKKRELLDSVRMLAELHELNLDWEQAFEARALVVDKAPSGFKPICSSEVCSAIWRGLKKQKFH